MEQTIEIKETSNQIEIALYHVIYNHGEMYENNEISTYTTLEAAEREIKIVNDCSGHDFDKTRRATLKTSYVALSKEELQGAIK